MKKRIQLLAFLLPACVAAQDIHFSQFQEHHALINPALTGSTGDYHGVVAYKNQWRKAAGAGSAYSTMGISYEASFLKGGIKKKKNVVPKTFRKQELPRLGAGLSIYRDRAGDGNWGTTLYNFSAATFVETGHWSFLSVGIQAGRSVHRVDQTSLIFPSQYASGGYSSANYSGESIPTDKYGYMDFAAGALWSYSYTEKGFSSSSHKKYRLGASVYHLTQPDLRVIGRGEEKLKMKIVVHGEAMFNLGKSKLAVSPAFLFQMQGQAKEIIVGGQVKYAGLNNSRYTGNVQGDAMKFGLYYRSGDAIILQYVFEKQEKYAFGLSYDLNVSPLRNATRLRGGPELMIKLIPREGYLRQKHEPTP